MAFFRTTAGNASGTIIPLFVRLNGAGDYLTSFVASAYALAYIFSPLLFGPISERIGRKRALNIATALTLVNFIVYLVVWPIFDAGKLVLGAVIVIFFIFRLLDGWWNGGFWPVLQGRISDERHQLLAGGDSAHAAERHLRAYNVGWNTGIVVGNCILIVATLPQAPAVILANLYWVMAISTASMAACVAIGFVFFKDTPLKLAGLKKSVNTPGKGARGGENRSHRDDSGQSSQFRPIFRRSLSAFLMTLAYAFVIMQVKDTMRNHFSFVATTGGLNLIPLIPATVVLRTLVQASASGLVKIPERPARRTTPVLAGIAVALGAYAAVVWAWPAVGVSGLILALGFMIVLGLFAGMLYALALSKIVNECGRENAAYFTGIFETLIGIGFFLAPHVSGSMTESLPYFTPYLVSAGVVLFVLAFSLLDPVMRRARATPLPARSEIPPTTSTNSTRSSQQ